MQCYGGFKHDAAENGQCNRHECLLVAQALSKYRETVDKDSLVNQHSDIQYICEEVQQNKVKDDIDRERRMEEKADFMEKMHSAWA